MEFQKVGDSKTDLAQHQVYAEEMMNSWKLHVYIIL